MAGKGLRRCSLCGGFHASYLVVSPTGVKSYLCYSCWKAKAASPDPVEQAAPVEEPPPSSAPSPVPQKEEETGERLRVGRKRRS